MVLKRHHLCAEHKIRNTQVQDLCIEGLALIKISLMLGISARRRDSSDQSGVWGDDAG